MGSDGEGYSSHDRRSVRAWERPLKPSKLTTTTPRRRAGDSRRPTAAVSCLPARLAAPPVEGAKEVPASGLVLAEREPGDAHAVLVGLAVAAPLREVLGEDGELGHLVLVDELGELREVGAAGDR